MNQEELVEGYLRYLEAAQLRKSRTLEEDNRAPSDSALALVAAGPLEDLLKKHGPVVVDRVEEESRKNDRLRLALSGVWGIYPGNPIYERWHALMWKYGFAEGKR